MRLRTCRFNQIEFLDTTGSLERRWAWKGGELNFFHFPVSGEPILFLHGVTRRWQTFTTVPNILRSGWGTYALDFPGHGSSKASLVNYYVREYSAVAGEFLESVISRPAVLYGHSLGAMVAVLVTGQIPQLATALILEDPPFHTMGNRLKGTHHYQYFASLRELIRPRSEMSELTRQLSAMNVADPASGSRVPLAALRDAASIRFTASCLMKLDPAVLDPILAGDWLNGYEVRQNLAAVRCPTLLLQADPKHGGMLSDEDAQLAESMISDCTLVRVPGCGHLIHGLQPNEASRFTLTFLAFSTLSRIPKYVDRFQHNCHSQRPTH